LRIVVPVTDWKEHYEDFSWLSQLRPDKQNGLRKLSAADSFQCKSFSLNRFESRIGTLADDKLREVVNGIAMCVGYSSQD